MSEQDTTTTTTEVGGPARYRWEVEAEIIAPHGVNLNPVVQAFTDLQVYSLQGRTDLLRPTAPGALAQRWERALNWSEELPDLGHVNGCRVVAIEGLVSITLRGPDGRAVSLTGGGHERVMFGRGKSYNHYHRLDYDREEGWMDLLHEPVGDLDDTCVSAWVWRPNGVEPQAATTGAEERGPARFRWEVEAEIVAPQGVNLDPLAQAFTTLMARSLQGPIDSLKPQGNKYLGERLEEALYESGPWPDFGRHDHGARIIAFEGSYDLVLRAPDGSETYIGGQRLEWWNRRFGHKQWERIYSHLKREGEVERRFVPPNKEADYRLPIWVWKPDLDHEMELWREML